MAEEAFVSAVRVSRIGKGIALAAHGPGRTPRPAVRFALQETVIGVSGRGVRAGDHEGRALSTHAVIDLDGGNSATDRTGARQPDHVGGMAGKRDIGAHAGTWPRPGSRRRCSSAAWANRSHDGTQTAGWPPQATTSPRSPSGRARRASAAASPEIFAGRAADPTVRPARPAGPDVAATRAQAGDYVNLPKFSRRCNNRRSSTLWARFRREPTVPAEQPRMAAIWS